MKGIDMLRLLLLLLLAAPAFAAPGSTPWTKEGGGTGQVTLYPGDTLIAKIPVGSTEASTELNLREYTTLCFDPDVNSTGGATRVTFYRRLSSPVIDNSRITVPAIVFDGTDCDVLPPGWHWFEVDTPPSAGQEGLVTVTANPGG
jgi:hypothetical protein